MITEEAGGFWLGLTLTPGCFYHNFCHFLDLAGLGLSSLFAM